MISACAAPLHRFIPPCPSSGELAPLLSTVATPIAAIIPSVVRTPSVPLGYPPSFPHIVFPVFPRISLRPFSSTSPSPVRVSLSLPPNFPSLPSRSERSSLPRDFPRQASSLCLRFRAFFLACRSVSPPSDPRRSLFARVTHRRGETIRRFPGWHLVSRAAFFLSVTLSLASSLCMYLSLSRSCLLSSQRSCCYR